MVVIKGVLRNSLAGVPWLQLPFPPIHLEDGARQQVEEELGEPWAV